ncbi:MAG: sulfur oxidation c-type cytochrome SoxX [Gammaproteobacteria bacterium]|nr:sulfur oxidation c-type cytochrome SoxX [Gammaproteobacteria bacterium]
MGSFCRWTATRAVLALVICILLEISVAAQASNAATRLDAGREIAFTSSRGNCLACHVIRGGDSPGNIGPPLIAIKSRFSDKEMIRKIIWDPRTINPETPMPLFGKNLILSKSEIDQLVDYIWSL